MAVYTNSKELDVIKESTQDEKGAYNMCTAIKELIEDSKDEGRLEGIREGKLEGIREGKLEIYNNCIAAGMTEAEALAITGLEKSDLI